MKGGGAVGESDQEVDQVAEDSGVADLAGEDEPREEGAQLLDAP